MFRRTILAAALLCAGGSAALAAPATGYHRLTEDELLAVCKKAVGPDTMLTQAPGATPEQAYQRALGSYVSELARLRADPRDMALLDTMCGFYLHGANDMANFTKDLMNRPAPEQQSTPQLAQARPKP
jgi:hypothetical protein